MPTDDLSKYAQNQFLTATVGNFNLMSESLADTLARSTAVVGSNALFTTVMANLNAAATSWNTGESAIATAEAVQKGATFALDDKLASLTRKPDADTNSLLEGWDNTIRSQVAFQGPVYITLLPQGRDTVTTGSKEEQIDALRDFALRLSLQTSKPTLVSLGIIVSTFATAARALRTTQTGAKGTLDSARENQEARRVTAAAALFAVVGQGIVFWSSTAPQVDTLWDVNILRQPATVVPGPPADTTWTPAVRTLSTTALPPGATRLEAWRVGPGGMPELLLTAAPGATAVIIPATITFTPGSLYQLWLCAVNSRGRSTPGPVQNWTAV